MVFQMTSLIFFIPIGGLRPFKSVVARSIGIPPVDFCELFYIIKPFS